VFRPRVAVLLRGAPKLALRLFAHQTARDCLVLSDDPELRAQTRAARAHVVWLSVDRALDEGVYIARDRIVARLNGELEDICSVEHVGAGRFEPVLAAVACALWAGLAPRSIGAALLRHFAIGRPGADAGLPRESSATFVAPSAPSLAERARAVLSLVGRRRGSAA
jgi:hypothetical protein